MALPAAVRALLEPALGVLADPGRRRALILGGGVPFCLAVALAGLSRRYWELLASLVLFYPASGAFVSLSQATLMDFEPRRREANMARWAFAGSIGMASGPLLVSAFIAVGSGWRALFLLLAALSGLLVSRVWRAPFPPSKPERADWPSFGEGLRRAGRALCRLDVIRWLVLLQLSDLMIDVLIGFLALYFVDVEGASPGVATLAVSLWTAAGLAGDLLVIPLLERVPALSCLRFGAAAMIPVFAMLLLVGSLPLKLVLLALVGMVRSGWYATLEARLYGSLPGKAGTALALGNVAAVAGALLPLALSALAQVAGLRAAMWLFLAGPLALLVGLPRRTGESS